MKKNKLNIDGNRKERRKISEIKAVNIFLRIIGIMSGVIVFILAAVTIVNYSVIPVNFMVVPICIFSFMSAGFILIVLSLPKKFYSKIKVLEFLYSSLHQNRHSNPIILHNLGSNSVHDGELGIATS